MPNLRIFHGDGVVALETLIPPGSLAGIRSWFPDPWPKQRHHKRRLIRPELVALMSSRLAPGGTVHVATDVAAYADVINDVLRAEPTLEPVLVAGPRPSWRPVTKFERAGELAGRPSKDFIFRRSPGDPVATVEA